MARWLRALVGLAVLALIALAWLAWGDLPAERQAWVNPYRQTLNRMSLAQRQDRALLARALRVDSLRPLLSPAPGLTVEFRANLRPDLAAALRATVAAELADVQPLRSRIGVFTVPPQIGSVADDDALGSPAPGVEHYASEAEQPAFCMVVGVDGSQAESDTTSPFDARVRVRQEGGRARAVPDDILGPCLFWAKYGAPGTGILAWLKRGGAHFATSNVAVAPVPDSLRRLSLRAAWWLEWRGSSDLPSCRAGYEPECRLSLRTPTDPDLRLDPRAPAGVLIADQRAAYYASDQRATTEALLASVEREFGAERFARFWRSNEDVEAAFAGAFGAPFVVWVIDWSREIWGAENRGPRVGWIDFALTLLVIALFVGLAARAGARRTAQH